MDQYELIRTAHYRYGKGVREIAREYGHSRKTVRKALRGSEPRYRRIKDRTAPVMGLHQDVVDRWLVEDQERPRKQRHTAARVYHRLVEEYGFSGGESTVRRCVRMRRAALGLGRTEAMVPLTSDLDSGAEVDWGEAWARIGGMEQKVKMFCMRSRFSGKIFVQAYAAERQEMLFDGHMKAFEFYGGVFKKITYDNLTTAVRQVLRGRRRDEQKQFLRFRSYYSFASNFCAPAKGHEKGGVEGLVSYARRNFLVPEPEFATLEEMNVWLLTKCQDHGAKLKYRSQETIDALHEQEKTALIATQPKPFENMRLKVGRVNKYQTVQVETNSYSVPAAYVGHRVEIHLECWRIRVFANHRQIACHERCLGKGEWRMDPFHYLGTLRRKTRAFDRAVPVEAWRRSWPAYYERFLAGLRRDLGQRLGTQEFIDVLGFHANYEADEVAKCIRECVERGTLRASSVKHMIFRNRQQTAIAEPLHNLEGLPKQEFTGPSTQQFDQLGLAATR